MKLDLSGPAFPSPHSFFPTDATGLSRREYLAAEALTAVMFHQGALFGACTETLMRSRMQRDISDEEFKAAMREFQLDPPAAAKAAVALADALLAELAQPKPEAPK